MFRHFKIAAVAAGALLIATPSFADEFSTLPTDLMTTVTTDLSKAEFNPTEILTPKPIEAAAPEPAAKVKKKRHARRHSKKMAAK